MIVFDGFGHFLKAFNMNVFRGKLNEATQSIKFEFFERLDSFSFYIPLENAKLIQLKTGAYYLNQDQAYYHIINLEK